MYRVIEIFRTQAQCSHRHKFYILYYIQYIFIYRCAFAFYKQKRNQTKHFYWFLYSHFDTEKIQQQQQLIESARTQLNEY